jgi:GTP cyclohydrolase II
VLVIPCLAQDLGDSAIARTRGAAIRGFRAARARDIRIVGRAPVPLDGAPETEFVVFRGGEGLRDQVAIIVGKPDRAEPSRSDSTRPA